MQVRLTDFHRFPFIRLSVLFLTLIRLFHMQGNRHRFGTFLYAAIFLVTIILGSFGISGYLCYGNDVNQIITKNLPSDLHIVKLTSITLCIGIIFTYPLQVRGNSRERMWFLGALRYRTEEKKQQK